MKTKDSQAHHSTFFFFHVPDDFFLFLKSKVFATLVKQSIIPGLAWKKLLSNFCVLMKRTPRVGFLPLFKPGKKVWREPKDTPALMGSLRNEMFVVWPLGAMTSFPIKHVFLGDTSLSGPYDLKEADVNLKGKKIKKDRSTCHHENLNVKRRRIHCRFSYLETIVCANFWTCEATLLSISQAGEPSCDIQSITEHGCQHADRFPLTTGHFCISMDIPENTVRRPYTDGYSCRHPGLILHGIMLKWTPYKFHWYEISRIGKSEDSSWERWGSTERGVNVSGVAFRTDTDILGLRSGDACTPVWTYSMPLSCTLSMVNFKWILLQFKRVHLHVLGCEAASVCRADSKLLILREDAQDLAPVHLSLEWAGRKHCSAPHWLL